MFAHKFPGEGLQDLKEADRFDGVHDCNTAKLRADHDQWTTEEDEEDSDIIVERPQPRTIAHKKIFQIMDDFIGIGHYMNRYQKLKKELETTIIPYKYV